MAAQDGSEALIEAIREALALQSPLAVRGGNSKAFYGRKVAGKPLDVGGQRGIVHYEPTELVITARAGTPLTEIEAVLAEQGQMLPFEPPHFGAATLGGCVAAGLSGPRRLQAGAARDHVLGVELLNGKAKRLRFGGEVMKNVAGYDVSRLMTGALGTLGVILEASLKLLPAPDQEITLVRECDAASANEATNRWASQPLPISATCHHKGTLFVRLSGSEQGVQAARKAIGGEEARQPDFWTRVREQRLAYFDSDGPLWRIAAPPASPLPDLAGEWLVEWSGALRWLKSDAPARTIREAAAQAGGHATLFRGGDRSGDVFHPLPPPLMRLHRRLKQSFDPQGIFNPGRMYDGL